MRFSRFATYAAWKDANAGEVVHVFAGKEYAEHRNVDQRITPFHAAGVSLVLEA
jgi:hypothetical protein